MPQVAVVLIFLNEERFIEEAVHSVLNQTLTEWELVMVDDGSTDRSSQIARDFAAADHRIRYVDHPGHQNLGMAKSRNVGVSHTSAPFVAFIDGDDVWAPEKLAEQVDLLEQMPDVAMINGAMCYWHSWDPTSVQADRTILTGSFTDRRLDPPEAALAIHPLGPTRGAGVDLMVRRSVFEAVGGFAESFRGMFEDQSFLVRVFLRYPVYISGRAWLLYRQHPDSSCARTSRVSYVRLRGVFLEWLEADARPLKNGAVDEAVLRARRRLHYQKALAPGLQLIDRVRDRVPDNYIETALERLPSGVGAPIRRGVSHARAVWQRWWL